MSSNLTPAIIGLIGVIIGSGISMGTNYLLAVRKETAEAAASKLVRVSDLRTAARLVGQEILTAYTAANMVVEQKRWVHDGVKFPLEAWQRDKGVLALELSFSDWNAVGIAALAVEHFRDFHSSAHPGVGADATDTQVEIGRPMLVDMAKGLAALRPHMLDASQ